MRGIRAATLISVSAAAAVVLAGCGGDSPAGSANPTQTSTTAQDQTLTPKPTMGLPRGNDPVDLDPGDFSTDITHPYLPMKPGTRWTYRERADDGSISTVVVTVTGATKQIANGITARVVRDTVTTDGELAEDTLDWYAQDSAGNIWYLGEDTAEFGDGKVSTREGSFEAGVDGALPGIALPGSPTDGMAYRQEYYAGEAEDNGEVLSTQEMAEVRAGRFENVLLTKDTITIEPDILEYKFYAPGVGLVLALDISGGSGREELVSMRRVSAAIAARAATAPLGTPYG